MPNKEDVLQFTNLGTDTVHQRVWYTITRDHSGEQLSDEEKGQRSSELLSLLIEKLADKGILGESDIDDLLFNFGQREFDQAGG